MIGVISGSKLKKYRKKANLTQQELGNLVGVHEATICKYEREVGRNPTVETLKRMANVFGCLADDLYSDNFR